MKRNLTKIRLGDESSRYRVLLESDDCEPSGMESRQQQYGLLRTIVDNPGMLDCGPAVFETMRMHHDGSRWVIELEAVAT